MCKRRNPSTRTLRFPFALALAQVRTAVLAAAIFAPMASAQEPRALPAAHSRASAIPEHGTARDESSNAQEAADGSRSPADLKLRDFRPRSMLRVADHTPRRAAFPVVDVHTHFMFKLRPHSLDDYVALMDRNNIAVCATLDGQLGEDWDEQATLLWQKYKERFVIFVHIDWKGAAKEDDFANYDCHRPDFARRIARQLAEVHAKGASGLKLFKAFGLEVKNPDGNLVRIDDPRWDPIWDACGQLEMPVLIHSADPAAFFEPIDNTNERVEELARHPDWSFHGDQFPSRQQLLAARNRVFARHPKTKFIGAHVANCAEDLAQVGEWLDLFPNLYVDIASRIGELGRQPYTAKRFFRKYQDRILFGTDGPWPETRLKLYWRFLETEDEYFPYSEKPFPPQGLWQIYGLDLDRSVLQKIYYENAARVIPGVQQRIAPRLELPPSGR